MRHNLHECGKRGNNVSLSWHGKKVREQYFSGIHFNNLQIISSDEYRGTLELTKNFTHV